VTTGTDHPAARAGTNGHDRGAAVAAPRPVAGGRAAPGGRTSVTTAVLVATAPAAGGPAAGQPWEGATVLRRLVEQLAGLGVRTAHVVTRPAWAADLERGLAGVGAAVRVRACASPADDLLAIAAVAREADGGLALLQGDVVTHREALAGLLADPRVATGILTVGSRRPLAFRVRTARGRVVSAASPFHLVHRPTTTFLGIVKVADADRAALVDVAERLAGLTAEPRPPEWDAELGRKERIFRAVLARRALGGDDAETESDGDGDGDAAAVVLSAADEAEARRRVDVISQDVVSLLVVGLVRSGVQVGAGYLRQLFWARPLLPEQLEQARVALGEVDEDRALLGTAVKASDGFFTSFFVSPYSKYIARWAAHRGFTPNAVTTVSLLIGLLAAALFATGERWGLVAGAVLAYFAFVTDCVDGQLARYTRTFSKLGAWLDSVFDRTKEYALFAGLAIGASNAGDPVWVLAGAALALQTVRHTLDFSFAAAQHQVIGAAPHAPLDRASDRARGAAASDPVPADLDLDPPDEPGEGGDALPDAAPASPAVADAAALGPAPSVPLRTRVRRSPGRLLRQWRRLDRAPGAVWVKRMVAFPIGERFAVISLTAALATPRTTFVVLLAWGVFAFVYALAGRVLRALAA
jgi:phosphatidylglycerophosphate synthase